MWAFMLTTSSPVIPLRVFVARLSPWSTASCQLFEDAAVIFVTRATAMAHLRAKSSLHEALDTCPVK
jgi:hypothetical protein